MNTLPKALSFVVLAGVTAVLVGAQTPTPKPEPHSGRWHVSWGVDPEVSKIAPTPVLTPIAKLVTFKRPSDLPKKGKTPDKYKAHRYAPVEVTQYLVRGTIIGVAAEHDGDYRLKITDGKGHSIIVVLPDPALAPIRGKFSDRIDAFRAVVANKFHPTFEERAVSVPAEIVGIGYFGRLDPEENPSPEGFQLHPGLSIKFLGKKTQ